MAKISREISSSIVSTISREAIVGLGQIVLTPLFIIRFGQDDYTKWLTVLAYTSFIVLADFGLSTVIVGKLIFILEHFNTFDFPLLKWFKRRTLFLATCMAITMAFFCAQKFPFRLDQSDYFNPNMQLYIALTASSFITLSQHFWLYRLQIEGRAALGQKSLTVVRSVEILTLALLLQMPLSISNFAWIFVFLKFLTYLFLRLSRKEFLNSVKVFDSVPDTTGLLLPAISNGFITAANLISLHGSFIVASFWLDSPALIAIVIARMLASPIRILGTAITTAMLPFLIRAAHAKGFESQSRNLLNNLPRLSISALLFGAGSLFIASKSLWNILSHNLIQFNGILVIWFIIATLSDSILAIKFQRAIASNKAFVSGSVYLLVTVILTISQQYVGNLLGMIAVPICITIADIMVILYLYIREWLNAN